MENESLIRPDELLEGQYGEIVHWVNQPSYIGKTLENRKGLLHIVGQEGIVTKSIDMRYPWYCKVRIYDNQLAQDQQNQ